MLKRSAGVQSGTGLPTELGAPLQRCPVVEARVAAQELQAVTGPGGLAAAQIGESDSVRELAVPGAMGEQRAGRRIDLGDDMGRGDAALDAQHPLRIARDRQSTFSLGAILYAEARDLDRIFQGNELEQVQRDAL